MNRTAAAASTAGDAAEDASSPWPWLRRHPWPADLMVVLAVLGYGLLTLPVAGATTDAERHGQMLALGLIGVGLGALHLLRRRFPLIVLAGMLVLAAAQLLVHPLAGLMMPDVLVAFAVYTVATRFRWPVSIPAAAVAAAWVPLGAHALFERGWIRIGEVGLLVVVIGWAWTWGTLVRIRRDHTEALKDRARRLEREREALARAAVAEERARIAREIHDIVAHGLGVVVVLSEGAAAAARTEPERAERAMQIVRDTGRSALGEMRRVLDVLREDEPGSHTPQPCLAQLPDLLERWSEAGLPVTVTVVGEPAELAEGLDLTAYRIVQEALTNVHRHAGPVDRVEVRLEYGSSELEIRVRDDGAGAGRLSDSGEPDTAEPGHGLVGMRERVTAYGGRLHTGDRPGGGFQVRAVLPVQEEDA